MSSTLVHIHGGLTMTLQVLGHSQVQVLYIAFYCIVANCFLLSQNNYKVRNTKESDVMLRELRHFHSKFDGVIM